VTVGVAEVELSGRVLRVNSRCCELFGRPMEDVVGSRIQELTHPDQLGKCLAQFDHLGGSDFVIEERYERPDYSIVWINYSVTLAPRCG